jgi:glutamate--cysteine ligase
MMRKTASVQVNVDLGAPDVVDDRWHLAHDLGPLLTACFANSPFDGSGRPSGYRSTRAAVWSAIDPARTTPARRDPSAAAAAEWARYVLDAPVMMVRIDDDHSVPLHTHRTFEQWLAEGHALGWPTRDDLAYHLTTLFPPVRPRGWLELRMIDSLPEEWWPVAVAVTVALLDDPSAAEHARRATVTTRERWETAARSSLRDPCFAEAARTCFDAARRALPHLGADPETLVAVDDYRERFIDRARCPADDLLDEWSGRAVPVR